MQVRRHTVKIHYAVVWMDTNDNNFFIVAYLETGSKTYPLFLQNHERERRKDSAGAAGDPCAVLPAGCGHRVCMEQAPGAEEEAMLNCAALSEA